MSGEPSGKATSPAPPATRSTRDLIRATVLVLGVAVVLLVTVVLPAELGIDPTGAGEVTGLTEMGEFKVEADSQFAAIEEFLAQQAADSAAAAARARRGSAP